MPTRNSLFKKRVAEFTWDNDDPLKMSKTETTKSSQALFDYAQMGVGRSLARLAKVYQGRGEKFREFTKNPPAWSHDEPIPQPVPTTSLNILADWSSKYHWQERVVQFDTKEREADALEYRAERQKYDKKARELARALYEKAVEALKNAVATGVDLEAASRIVERALEQLRVVYGVSGEAVSKEKIPSMIEVVIPAETRIGVNIPKKREDDE